MAVGVAVGVAINMAVSLCHHILYGSRWNLGSAVVSSEATFLEIMVCVIKDNMCVRAAESEGVD